jgi:hypothetical protein
MGLCLFSMPGLNPTLVVRDWPGRQRKEGMGGQGELAE